MARPRVVVAVIIVAVASIGGWRLGEARRAATAEWIVTEVLDGDTIRVARGDDTDTVRLLGIDTPETHHPTKPVECFGPEAATYAEVHLLGRSVELEADIEERDRYGRWLAYVIVDGERFNDDLVRRGFARLLVIEPNHAHARVMLQEELDAKRARRGLWGEC